MKTNIVISIPPVDTSETQRFDLTHYLGHDSVIGDVYEVKASKDLDVSDFDDTSFLYSCATGEEQSLILEIEKVIKQPNLTTLLNYDGFTPHITYTSLEKLPNLKLEADDAIARKSDWYPYQKSAFLKRLFTIGDEPDLSITTHSYRKSSGDHPQLIIDGLMRYKTLMEFLNNEIGLDGQPIDKTSDRIYRFLSLSDKKHFNSRMLTITNYQKNGERMSLSTKSQIYVDKQDVTKPSSSHIKKISKQIKED